MEICSFCHEPLSNGPTSEFQHPLNGNCTGYNIHTTCGIEYYHGHIVGDANFVCLRCTMPLGRESRFIPHGTPEEIERQTDQIEIGRRAALDERARRQAPIPRARARREILDVVFETLPPECIDIFFGVIAGRAILNIVGGSNRIGNYLNLGVCIRYGYARAYPFLRRRGIAGGKRKSGKKKTRTRKIGGNKLLPDDVCVIEVRNPTPELIAELEKKIGVRAKKIDYDRFKV
jgi:hypothetical protein